MIKEIHKRRVFDNKQARIDIILKAIYKLHERIILTENVILCFYMRQKIILDVIK